MTFALISVLIFAPLGAILGSISGPVLLEKETKDEYEIRVEYEHNHNLS